MSPLPADTSCEPPFEFQPCAPPCARLCSSLQRPQLCLALPRCLPGCFCPQARAGRGGRDGFCGVGATRVGSVGSGRAWEEPGAHREPWVQMDGWGDTGDFMGMLQGFYGEAAWGC